MKGKLLKRDNKWVVIVNDSFTCFEVDLHPDDIENIQRFNDAVWDLNGKEVFFEIVTKYIEPDDSIHCNRGGDKEFAKLIDEERRKEALSEIIKQAQELGMDIDEDGFFEFNNWNDDKVIDFVNWFLKLKKLPFRYTLENKEILESFKRGDDFSIWHTKEE